MTPYIIEVGQSWGYGGTYRFRHDYYCGVGESIETVYECAALFTKEEANAKAKELMKEGWSVRLYEVTIDIDGKRILTQTT